jgi:dipeptidyl aminopeptidase/acylaminoacyl peptidase
MKHLLAVLAMVMASGAAVGADEAKPSVETLFKLPQYRSMEISPDGKYIAALAPSKGRMNVVVIDIADHKALPVTGFEKLDVVTVGWLNNHRLLFSVGRLGVRDDDSLGGGLLAVDRDGKNFHSLDESGGGNVARPLTFVRTLPDESNDFIAQQSVFEAQRMGAGGLFRVNSLNGRRTPISLGQPDSAEGESWIVDSKGVARVLVAVGAGRVRIHYRASEDAPWKKLDEYSAYAADQWFPIGLTQDEHGLYVSARIGRDKGAVMRYDPDTKSFGEIIAAHPQVDLDTLIHPYDKVVGVRYDADKLGAAWFDEDLAKVQKGIDGALPATTNLISWSRDRERFLVTSISDVLPGSFYLFERKTGKLEWLADSAPWIDPRKMTHVQPVRYAARDGLEIPAYLTVPRNTTGKNLPMVVMVHGGPWVPGDNWYFNPEVQFLAARGYVVLQPNFRGTTRYGWKHFSSSFKQWGLTMQDDVTDGVEWAIKEGIADPKRVCIYGASYGGYATMMGLAKTPDLYKCGINYVGVTDLKLFSSATWSDIAYSEFQKYGMKDMIGDIQGDTERLKNTSPVEMAARIKAPVFMAYGAADVRVVPEHGTRMKAALERVGQHPQWMIADGEGHGYSDPANQVMFYGAMEKFLDENIGH